VVSFKNAMVILTSNVGSRVIASSAAGGAGLSAFGRKAAGPDGEEEEEDERVVAADRVGGAAGLRAAGPKIS
jgi:ATP-dependent Clp protease ATP-binding subunit ClpA